MYVYTAVERQHLKAAHTAPCHAATVMDLVRAALFHMIAVPAVLPYQ